MSQPMQLASSLKLPATGIAVFGTQLLSLSWHTVLVWTLLFTLPVMIVSIINMARGKRARRKEIALSTAQGDLAVK